MENAVLAVVTLWRQLYEQLQYTYLRLLRFVKDKPAAWSTGEKGRFANSKMIDAYRPGKALDSSTTDPLFGKIRLELAIRSISPG
ncbi:hypothetical protein XPA_009040 [Xanthoria parietina]